MALRNMKLLLGACGSLSQISKYQETYLKDIKSETSGELYFVQNVANKTITYYNK
jgi:hypothetical protein